MHPLEIDLASNGAPSSASGAGLLAHNHPLQTRPLTCTPPASRAHFNLSGGPHTGESRPGQVHSQIMAMRELKLPMLKHSRATSMKNSITCALCFFLAGWGGDTGASVGMRSPLQTPQSTSLTPLLFSRPISQLRSSRARVSGPFLIEAACSSEVCRADVAQ